jgi:hypothetical protein
LKPTARNPAQYFFTSVLLRNSFSIVILIFPLSWCVIFQKIKTALCVWWMATHELVCALGKAFFIQQFFRDSFMHCWLFLVSISLRVFNLSHRKYSLEHFSLFCYVEFQCEFIKLLLIFNSIHLSYHFVSLWRTFLFPQQHAETLDSVLSIAWNAELRALLERCVEKSWE